MGILETEDQRLSNLLKVSLLQPVRDKIQAVSLEPQTVLVQSHHAAA